MKKEEIQSWLRDTFNKLSQRSQLTTSDADSLQTGLLALNERELFYLYYEIARDFGVLFSLQEIEEGIFENSEQLVTILYQRSVKAQGIFI